MKIFILNTLVFLIFPVFSLAAPIHYTNENFTTDGKHDRPLSFQADGTGGFYGVTVSGMTFTQTPISNIYGIKLHKFSIGQAYFYMSDKGEIVAKNDLVALSIYFSKA
ncbi:hypothetical protein KC845_03775 [Candidatus Kaiserbacteria bacterium]|nr:hypothetical protein [Candidatus Kaiserbacteria bacterium]